MTQSFSYRLSRVVSLVAGLAIAAVAPARAAMPAAAAIVIGNISDQTGYIAPIAGTAWSNAVDVWAKWINDKGGIAGHPVVVINRDTQSVPATAAKVLNELLSDPKVVAVVHGANDTMDGAAIAKAPAPVIGAAADQDVGYTNPNVFPASTTADAVWAAIGRLGVTSSPGHPNGSVPHAEGIGGESIPPLQAGAKKAGGDVIDTPTIPSTSPDYAALCASAKAKDIGWISVLHYPATISSLAEACAKIGYKPVWVTLPAMYVPDWLNVPALDGTKIVLTNALFSGDLPAAKEFRAAVAKYDPEQLKQPTFGETSLMAWTALQLVAKAIEEAHPKGAEVTREDVYRGLYSLKSETLGGLAPPLTFVRGKPTVVNCHFIAEIKNGKLVPTSHKPVC